MQSFPVPIVAAGGADADAASSRRRWRGQARGGAVDPAVLAAVRSWIADEPPRRDRLIEYLHAINDRPRLCRSSA